MAGTIAPDIDLLYFFFVDGRQQSHHSYFTHYPLTWGVLLAVSLLIRYRSRKGRLAILFCVFALSGMLHLVLDSVVGDIRWLAPFSDHHFSLFSVTTMYSPWGMNFILHWSFGLELLICLWAVVLWQRQRATPGDKMLPGSGNNCV